MGWPRTGRCGCDGFVTWKSPDRWAGMVVLVEYAAYRIKALPRFDITRYCCTHLTTELMLFPLTRMSVWERRLDLVIKTHAGRGDACNNTWMFHEASHMQSDDRIMSCISSLLAPVTALAQCRADKNGLLSHL